MVSVLADFFMEKGSPLWAAAPEKNPVGLEFGVKKHTMGNKFSTPYFAPLFQCISHMLLKIDSTHTLAANDLACL